VVDEAFSVGGWGWGFYGGGNVEAARRGPLLVEVIEAVEEVWEWVKDEAQ